MRNLILNRLDEIRILEAQFSGDRWNKVKFNGIPIHKVKSKDLASDSVLLNFYEVIVMLQERHNSEDVDNVFTPPDNPAYNKRFDAANNALNGLLSSPNVTYSKRESYVKEAYAIADELIKQEKE